MWENIKQLLKRLFEKVTNKTDEEINEHAEDSRRYEDTRHINIGAILANKLATMVITDSEPKISGDNPRAEMLQKCLSNCWNNAQEITSRALGTGGVALVPYIAGGKLYTDIVPKDRFFITRSQGTDIIGCSIIADVIVRKNMTYMRLTDYELEGNTYVIRNRASRQYSPCALNILPEWAEIPEEIRIQNCDRLLLAYLRSPYNKGRTDNLYGVPITRGSDAIIEEINECLQQIRSEFKNKKSRIFADETLFGKNDNLDAQLYKTTMGGGSLTGAAMFEVFDPAIRDSSYYNRLTQLFALLEKSVGTSRGVLTDAVSMGATATEIKRASFDTYALISSVRKQWQMAADDLVNAYNVMANAYNVTPTGDYEIDWKWSDSLVESSTETWSQLKDGKAEGVISAVELRQHLIPSESIDKAAEAIAEIKTNEPTLAQLIGE